MNILLIYHIFYNNNNNDKLSWLKDDNERN